MVEGVKYSRIWICVTIVCVTNPYEGQLQKNAEMRNTSFESSHRPSQHFAISIEKAKWAPCRSPHRVRRGRDAFGRGEEEEGGEGGEARG